MGSPVLRDIIDSVSRTVPSPISGSMRDVWDGSVQPAGSGSDHTAFIQVAGVSSVYIILASNSGSYEAVYHSNYDNLYWADHFSDPGFVFHGVMSRLTGRLLLQLADSTVIPFTMSPYSRSIQKWLSDMRQSYPACSSLANFSAMDAAIQLFDSSAKAFDQRAQQLTSNVNSNPQNVSVLAVRAHNDVARGVDTVFLGDSRSTGRGWYRHVIFTPSATNTYGSTVFPLIAEALTQCTGELPTPSSFAVSNATFAIQRVAQYVKRAAKYLQSDGVLPP